MKRLLVLFAMLAVPQTAFAADDVTGFGRIFGGGVFSDGTNANVIGGDGAVLLRFSDNFGVQLNGQLSTVHAEASSAGGQINLNGNPFNVSSVTNFASKLRALYLDPDFALAIGGGLGEAGGRQNYNGGADGALFFDRFTLRTEASLRNGENDYNTLVLGTLGVDLFPFDNLAVSVDGSYGQVISRGSSFGLMPFDEGDAVFMATLGVDYRFDSDPLGVGVGYGYFTTSPSRGDDVHMLMGRGTVYFGSQSIKDSRQSGTVFGRTMPFIESFLDSLL